MAVLVLTGQLSLLHDLAKPVVQRLGEGLFVFERARWEIEEDALDDSVHGLGQQPKVVPGRLVVLCRGGRRVVVAVDPVRVVVLLDGAVLEDVGRLLGPTAGVEEEVDRCKKKKG